MHWTTEHLSQRADSKKGEHVCSSNVCHCTGYEGIIPWNYQLHGDNGYFKIIQQILSINLQYQQSTEHQIQWLNTKGQVTWVVIIHGVKAITFKAKAKDLTSRPRPKPRTWLPRPKTGPTRPRMRQHWCPTLSIYRVLYLASTGK